VHSVVSPFQLFCAALPCEFLMDRRSLFLELHLFSPPPQLPLVSEEVSSRAGVFFFLLFSALEFNACLNNFPRQQGWTLPPPPLFPGCKPLVHSTLFLFSDGALGDSNFFSTHHELEQTMVFPALDFAQTPFLPFPYTTPSSSSNGVPPPRPNPELRSVATSAGSENPLDSRRPTIFYSFVFSTLLC